MSFRHFGLLQFYYQIYLSPFVRDNFRVFFIERVSDETLKKKRSENDLMHFAYLRNRVCAINALKYSPAYVLHLNPPKTLLSFSVLLNQILFFFYQKSIIKRSADYRVLVQHWLCIIFVFIVDILLISLPTCSINAVRNHDIETRLNIRSHKECPPRDVVGSAKFQAFLNLPLRRLSTRLRYLGFSCFTRNEWDLP